MQYGESASVEKCMCVTRKPSSCSTNAV